MHATRRTRMLYSRKIRAISRSIVDARCKERARRRHLKLGVSEWRSGAALERHKRLDRVEAVQFGVALCATVSRASLFRRQRARAHLGKRRVDWRIGRVERQRKRRRRVTNGHTSLCGRKSSSRVELEARHQHRAAPHTQSANRTKEAKRAHPTSHAGTSRWAAGGAGVAPRANTTVRISKRSTASTTQRLCSLIAFKVLRGLLVGGLWCCCGFEHTRIFFSSSLTTNAIVQNNEF